MKKKLFALTMGLGMAFGAMNVSANACACNINFYGCIDEGYSYSNCIDRYNRCMEKYPGPGCEI